MATWSPWGSCNLMADGSCSRRRIRSVALMERQGGKLCPKASSFEECTDEDNKLQCSDGLPHNAKYTCSHVTCEYIKNKDGHGRVVVLHHNHETKGQGHLCAYSETSHSCSCLCSHDLKVTTRPICQNYMKGLTQLPCNDYGDRDTTSQQLVRN